MNLHRISFRLSLGAAAVLSALNAYAQEAEAPKKPPEPMQKVEVKGSTDNYDPRRDDTASKIIVNHDEIIKYGDTSVSEVLKRLPGITVGGAPGRGGEIRMRGLGSGYTQILLNGERAPLGFSIDSLAPDVIERIEVQRAASAEFSTQAIAGTINIVLKKAITTQQRELKPSLGFGHNLLNPVFNVQLSDRMGKMSYSLAVNLVGSKFKRDNPAVEEGFDPAGKKVLQRSTVALDDGSFKGVFIVPRLNWNLDGGDTLTSQSFINANHFTQTGFANVSTSMGPADPFPQTNSRIANSAAFLRSDLSWSHKIAAGGKLDAKFGINLGQTSNEIGQRGTGGPVLLDRFIEGTSNDKGWSSTGKYLSAAMEGHSLAFGWDVSYTAHDDDRIQRDAGVAKPLTENNTSDVARIAAFVQDEWNVTPRWSVYTGLRWEGIRTDNEGTNFGTVSNRSSVLSPLFQTLFKIPETKGDQLRFALTRTYKAPNTQNLSPRRITSINNSPTDPDRQGNPNLKPELATGFDASFEHYFAEGALLSVAVSTRRITDYNRSGLSQDPFGRWVVMPVNSGTANTHSLELEAKFPLRAVMKDALPIDLRANIARNWSRVESVPGPDNRLDQQTPLSSTVGVDYKQGQLTTGTSFTFKTAGHVRISAVQAGYQTVRRELEAFALWKFNPKTQLRFALQNLLRQDFRNESVFIDDKGGQTRRTAITPGIATARLNYEMKF